MCPQCGKRTRRIHDYRCQQIKDTTVRGKRIILIAGPSSSGKTTFAKRLEIQLRINEYNKIKNYDFDKKYDSPTDSLSQAKRILSLLKKNKYMLSNFSFPSKFPPQFKK